MILTERIRRAKIHFRELQNKHSHRHPHYYIVNITYEEEESEYY